MAHTCPICQSYCTCCGDWDDIDLGKVPNECQCCVYDIDEDDIYNPKIEDEDWEEERSDPNDSRNL